MLLSLNHGFDKLQRLSILDSWDILDLRNLLINRLWRGEEIFYSPHLSGQYLVTLVCTLNQRIKHCTNLLR
jgi:hypothetical protein